ncbi:MAG TPA: hypothetical protein VE222_08935 [Nitrospiraceae bacterium]|nr:hypothetical protein [Nitrospiraceae bacterium]
MTIDLLGVSIRPLSYYVLCAGLLSLAVRVVMALLKVPERKNGKTRFVSFIDNLKGFGSNRQVDDYLYEELDDYWYPFFLGFLEFLSYPVLIAADLWSFIGAWLVIKTAGQWEHWKKSRHIFNRFLIGNVLVIILSLLIMVEFVQIRDMLPP